MPATRTSKSRILRRADSVAYASQCTSTRNRIGPLTNTHIVYGQSQNFHATECQNDNVLYQSQNPSAQLPVDLRPQRLELRDLECIRTLGTGAFGKVVLTRVGKHRGQPLDRPGTVFATKVLTKRLMRVIEKAQGPSSDEKNYERSSLTDLPWSPFINGLVQTFQDQKNLYLMLELVPCGNLSNIMEKQGPIEHRTAAFYFSNIVCALDFLHEHGIVHRDLKPDNILVGADGYLCLADFGYAKSEEDTKDWMMLGTAVYMAPELLQQGAYLGRAIDWWASGCILFQMLAGTPPFYAKGELATFKRIASGVYKWPRNMDAFIGKNTKHIVKSLLTAEPWDRLGASGADEVKTHPWLTPINWNKLEKRLYLAPHVPPKARLTETWHHRKLPKQKKVPGLRVVHPPPRCRWDGRFNPPPINESSSC